MINIPSEIKMLLQKDGVRKNFRIHFPNGERADIINTNLVQGSVSLTESLCSRDKLKFGLCESPCLEFKTMYVENIKGMTIEVQVEIDVSSCLSETGECGFEYEQRDDLSYPTYPISYGKFVVESCEREGSSLQRRKVEAYSELGGDWEFNKITSAILNTYVFKKDLGDVYFSPKAIYTLLLSEPSEIEYVEFTDVKHGRSNFSYGFNMNDGRKYTLRYYYKTNSFTPKPWSVMFLKEHYSQEYIEKVEEIRNFLMDSKSSDLNLRMNDCNEKELAWHYNTYSGGDEYLEQEKRCSGNIKKLKYGSPFLKPYNNYSVQLYAENIYYETNTSTTKKYWLATTAPDKFIIPYRITVEDSKGFNIFDTGEFLENSLYINCDTEVLPKDGEARILVAKSRQVEIGMFHYNYDTNTSKQIVETAYALRKVSGINFREIIEAYLELEGVFGQIDRKTNKFELISLVDKGGLVPSETLAPSETLTPSGGVSQLITKKMYRQCWYDDEPTLPYGKVAVTYSNANDEVVTAELYLNGLDVETYDDSQYQTYDLSENYIIQNNTFDAGTINEILKKVGAGIANVQYMPAEISMNYGLPYLEIGDYVTVMLANAEIFDTLVLRRTISGIQALKDNYESKG